MGGFHLCEPPMKKMMKQRLFVMHADHSGLSGVQPKVMIRGINEVQSTTTADRQLQSTTSATHIVKFWESIEYSELAANEFLSIGRKDP
jgi:hypothetical protein